jgi:prepilin-type N-terminal cleavage/methylation domain-containing protein/prepilin-type processing-associated H-X9-DG protein
MNHRRITSSDWRPRRDAAPRNGFTIVELLVVMVIAATLLALALPAVTRMRGTARKTSCMNHLHNLAIALTQFDRTHGRLPASGYYFDPPSGKGGPHHSWAVSLLPWIEQGTLHSRFDPDKPLTDPANAAFKTSHVAAYVCPMDISRSKGDKPDQSYAVNGGLGFTIRTSDEVGDCPIAPNGTRLDLNGDGAACAGQPDDEEDRKFFKEMGAFFLENWKSGGTVRHHDLGDFVDGTSQTYLVSENARAGYDPNGNEFGFADPNPFRSAFYVGAPCVGGNCAAGNVDYSLCNSGPMRINSGLWSAEGKSSVPNSFHEGGVQMAYADGHVSFLSENVDGAVHAALASPQGILLDDTPLEQIVVSGGVQ